MASLPLPTSSSNASPKERRGAVPQLLSAARNDDVTTILRILSTDGGEGGDEDGPVDPNSADPATGHTALHVAALEANVDAVAALLLTESSLPSTTSSSSPDFAIDPNAVSSPSDGCRTPLHCAVCRADPPPRRAECVRLLLSSGADPNVGDVHGFTPRDYVDPDDECGDDDDASLCRSILEPRMNGGSDGHRRLFESIGRCDVAAVRRYINSELAGGSRDDERRGGGGGDLLRAGDVILRVRDKWTGFTPLLHAVDKLLKLCDDDEDGGNGNGGGEYDDDGGGGVAEVPGKKRVDDLRKRGDALTTIIRTLLVRGSDPNAVPGRRDDRLGRAPDDRRRRRPRTSARRSWTATDLDPVIENLYANVVAAPAPAVTDATTSDGDGVDGTVTPLHRLCEALCDAHASCPATPSGGSTAASAALASRSAARVKQLEKAASLFHMHGARTYLPTTLLLHDAAKKGNLPAVVFLLRDIGVSPNARGRRGSTALHLAARGGKLEVVRFLLSLAGGGHGNGGDDADAAQSDASKGPIERLDPTIKDERGRTALDLALQNGRHDVAVLLK